MLPRLEQPESSNGLREAGRLPRRGETIRAWSLASPGRFLSRHSPHSPLYAWLAGEAGAVACLRRPPSSATSPWIAGRFRLHGLSASRAFRDLTKALEPLPLRA